MKVIVFQIQPLQGRLKSLLIIKIVVLACEADLGPYEPQSWWINELRTLGLHVKKTYEFNDVKELSNRLLKQLAFLDYKTATN